MIEGTGGNIVLSVPFQQMFITQYGLCHAETDHKICAIVTQSKILHQSGISLG